MRTVLTALALSLATAPALRAQELNARVTINYESIETTKTDLFDELKEAMQSFLNDRQWTDYQFTQTERIACNFNITITKYTEASNSFECKAYVQSNRPVYGSAYTTTVFATQDNDFNFTYKQYDQLEFRPEYIDNELTALMAYYAYIIVGMDLESMSPKGGEKVLQMAKTLVQNAQNLSSSGWQAFNNDKNRYAIINDYMDNGMEPLRQMQYKYYREGLDLMTTNTERARAAITESIALMKQAKSNKPNSSIPQLFTEIKRDEFVNIYQGKGTADEKREVYNTLMSLDASQATQWRKIQR